MATEFNYARMWHEVYEPAFKKLKPVVKHAFELVCKYTDLLKQEKGDLSIQFPPSLKDLRNAFDDAFRGAPEEYVEEVADIVNNYGHLAPINKSNPVYKYAGATWKFEHLVKTWMLENCVSHLHAFKMKKEAQTKQYMDHKPGTEYSGEEVIKLLGHIPKVCKILDTRAVNFKVNGKPGHPFMIGSKHFTGGSMYLDPRSAPCAMRGCHQSYDVHSYDTAMFISVKADLLKSEELNKDLLALKDAISDHNAKNLEDLVKIDGFAFVEDKG